METSTGVDQKLLQGLGSTWGSPVKSSWDGEGQADGEHPDVLLPSSDAALGAHQREVLWCSPGASDLRHMWYYLYVCLHMLTWYLIRSC